MLEGTWIRTKNVTFKVASEVLGYSTTKHRDWFDDQDAKVRALLDVMHSTHLAWINDKSSSTKKAAYARARNRAETKLCDIKDRQLPIVMIWRPSAKFWRPFMGAWRQFPFQYALNTVTTLSWFTWFWLKIPKTIWRLWCANSIKNKFIFYSLPETFVCRPSVFSSATSLCSCETAACSCEFEVTSWETEVTSWRSTCSLLPQLRTSLSCWVASSTVGCDDVSAMTVIVNRLSCNSVAAILNLNHNSRQRGLLFVLFISWEFRIWLNLYCLSLPVFALSAAGNHSQSLPYRPQNTL